MVRTKNPAPATKSLKTRAEARAKLLEPTRAPIIKHLHELRRRLVYVALSVTVGSSLAYAIETPLVRALLRPSHGQHFVYTSPLGGVNFLFSVCLYAGIAISIPVLIFNFLQFIRPLMHATTMRFVFLSSIASCLIAIGGITFGYFAGLPAALHFLLGQFSGFTQIQALITVQAYLSFVIAYLLGSALMFQLPLILLFINRIKPLKPSQLWHYERHLIVGAFIIGFLMNPTPNLFDQLFVVAPLIIMYQLSIFVVWIVNRDVDPAEVHALSTEDELRRSQRTEQAVQLAPVVLPDTLPEEPIPVVAAAPAVKQVVVQATETTVDIPVTTAQSPELTLPDSDLPAKTTKIFVNAIE